MPSSCFVPSCEKTSHRAAGRKEPLDTNQGPRSSTRIVANGTDGAARASDRTHFSGDGLDPDLSGASRYEMILPGTLLLHVEKKSRRTASAALK